uniref:Uncharacterized protein n=1 Tax=Megaviridae environmental sample TaxID=1737588 RepID=A0A5J6VI48_9VIRU|nr:MAG: hypothetical protein [Megaviridae environmental sample]
MKPDDANEFDDDIPFILALLLNPHVLLLLNPHVVLSHNLFNFTSSETSGFT